MGGDATVDVILTIDQGTTNSKALLVDASGLVLGSGSSSVSVSYPRPGWVEQDLDDIWGSVQTAAHQAVFSTSAPFRVCGICLSTQRESAGLWDRGTGRPLGPLISWQDRRTDRYCAERRARSDLRSTVSRLTGLPLDAMFSASKLGWLFTHHGRDVSVDDVCAGTVESWLLWKLTGGQAHLGEVGMASRTLLFDVAGQEWSSELCEIFGVPRQTLPDVRSSDAGFGESVDLPGVADGTPVVAVLADSHAALFAHSGGSEGIAKATYGTGTSVMAPATAWKAGASRVPLTLAWVSDQPSFAREGNVVSSGSALSWTAAMLGLTSVAELVELAAAVPDAGGVQLIPAFAGLGAPHWDRGIRASISHLTPSSTRAHIARAALDAVAHQVADVVEAMVDEGVAVEVLRADGGASRSSLLMQTQADLLGRPVEVSLLAEASAIGAARMGWRTLGQHALWRSAGRLYTVRPGGDANLHVEQRRAWKRAIATARAAASETL